MGTQRTPEPGSVPVRASPATPVFPATSARTKCAPGVAFPMVDDLSAIAADDDLLDSIAVGALEVVDPVDSTAPICRPVRRSVSQPPPGPGSLLDPLLASWRAEILESPAPPLPELPPMASGKAAPLPMVSPPSRRVLRPMAGIAAAICALLLGSTAIAAQAAGPGDVLWPLTQVLYADHADSVQAKAAANSSLDSARVALSSGDPAAASVALQLASNEVRKVAATDGHDDLQQALDTLVAKVSTRRRAPNSDAGRGRGEIDRSTAGTGSVARIQARAALPGSPTSRASSSKPGSAAAGTPGHRNPPLATVSVDRGAAPSVAATAPTRTVGTWTRTSRPLPPTAPAVIPPATPALPGPGTAPAPTRPVVPMPSTHPATTQLATTDQQTIKVPTTPAPLPPAPPTTPPPPTPPPPTAPPTTPPPPTTAPTTATETSQDTSTTSELPTPTPLTTDAPNHGDQSNAGDPTPAVESTALQ